jgi:5-methylcytosine-specific restriction enzyme B
MNNEINQKYETFRERKQIGFITFHPSYSYEEFVEGITFRANKKEGEGDYHIKDGIFKKICFRALYNIYQKNKESTAEISYEECKDIVMENLEEIREIIKGGAEFDKFVLIIDEINRGDISKIFGELITLLEDDKRVGKENELITTLPYSEEEFVIPPNLHIIGTMNTADRSIALIDIALRRRFGFEEMMPILEDNGDTDCLYQVQKEKLSKEEFITFDIFRKQIIKLNEKISILEEIGRDKQIGHSFLFKIKTGFVNENISLIWNKEILPLLEEYCFQDRETMQTVLSEVPGLKDITDHAHLKELFPNNVDESNNE